MNFKLNFKNQGNSLRTLVSLFVGMIPGLKNLRIFVLSGMIMIITSDRPWGYRRRFGSKRCFSKHLLIAISRL